MGRMFIAASLLLALSAPALAGQVYKWVDDKGVTHFGAQPPQGQEAVQVNTTVAQPRLPAALPSLPAQPDPQRAIDDKVKQEVAEQEAQRQKYCTDLRTNLAQLRNNPRLRVTEDNGESRRLNQEERQSRIAETEKAIEDGCQ